MKPEEDGNTDLSAEDFLKSIMEKVLTPELRGTLNIPQNREMLEFELTKAAEKVVRAGFKR